MTRKNIPITDEEAKFLHGLGWSSGYGWRDGSDWYWDPSFGDPIWIEKDTDIMNLWLRDRDVYTEAERRQKARDHAVELLEALEELHDEMKDLIENPYENLSMYKARVVLDLFQKEPD